MYLFLPFSLALLLFMNSLEASALQLEQPRVLDEHYQNNRVAYSEKIKQLRYLLSVRATSQERKVLLGTPVYILNTGRAMAYSKGGIIYFDMALLDLVSQLADELSVAEIKKDPIHQIQFNLAYAKALNHDKQLKLLDPFNTIALNEEQKLYLWNAKLQSEQVIFENLLGFILAHEFSHLLLNHQRKVELDFPNESARSTANPEWNRKRRAMELETDELAARLCLNALIQPAQLLFWLHLNEIRRRYYGISAEYPTAAQRITVIQKVYDEIVGDTELDVDLTDFIPLAPDKDMEQIDYNLFFDEFQNVRKYRQTLLVEIDRTVVDMLKEGSSSAEALEVFIAFIEQQKDLLQGAANKPRLSELTRMIAKGDLNTPQDIEKISTKVKQAGIGPYAEAWIIELLKSEPIDWPQISQALELLNGERSQFLLGLTYEYMLANTILRWFPDIFTQLQKMLPDTEYKAKRLAPYILGQPFKPIRPTFSQRIETLRTWNGEYPKTTNLIKKPPQ